MSVIGVNIKKIRSVKGLNQTDFAKLFGLTRANIGSYEELRAEPKIDTIVKIATFYKLPIDKLVRKELTVNEISNFTALNELVIQSFDKKGETIYISKKHLEEYPSKKNSKTFLNQLPKIAFPFGTPKVEKRVLFNEGNELFFSDEGFLHGDILFLEKASIETSFLGVVFDNEYTYRGFVTIENSNITITPLNPNLKEKSIAYHKKVELWKIIGKYTSEVFSKAFTVIKLNALEKKIESDRNK